MSTNQGILIAVEGIDGAGKTTLVSRLNESLTIAGETVVCSKEPTNGTWGMKIRNSVTHGRMNLEDELEAFVEDRREHVRDLVQPALDRGEIVIIDRYFYSTIAYQGERGADVEFLTNSMRNEFPIPDITLLVDVLPAVGLDRISSLRSEIPNNFEQADSLTEIRQIFLAMQPKLPEIKLINGHNSIDAVYLESVHALLDSVLKSKRCAKSYDCDIFFCSYRMNGECQWAELHKKLPSSSVA